MTRDHVDPTQVHYLFHLIFSLPSTWGVQECMIINGVYETFSFTK